MATKGSKKTAASSQALNVGPQTPISGESASPTPAAVPLRPLTSAYVRTEPMNDIPVMGPMASSSTHHDFDPASCRHSFSSSHRKADLRERKKHLFEVVASGVRGISRCGHVR